ncbi:MAG TPA: ATP-binding protein [Burkholderiaceae bacterium]|nr:ATP-binding protein [Burkholderiaceae bacterium]
MMPRPDAFDRDIPLTNLLRSVPAPKLDAAMSKTVGLCWRIVDADGEVVRRSASEMDADKCVAPVRVDIEVIGHIEVPSTRRTHAEVAARWLEMVLAAAMRYQMAASLHLETVHADYEALQSKHAALQESEGRYRALAAQLEQRVKEQVDTIERTQRQLYQSEKMAAVGSLAAGMAHEINNPMGFIRSNLGTASKYVGTIEQMFQAYREHERSEASALWHQFDMDFLLEDFAGLLEESINGADRVSRIVTNLKAYASIDCASGTPVDLNDAVRAAADILHTQLPNSVQVEMALQPLQLVSGDASRLNQVLFALLQNARLAMGDKGGTIRVSSRMVGDEARIEVSDNGCGIPRDVINRIFDPFFTTREVGKGMGLGLTVSRDILNAHSGRIEVTSIPGEGSTFAVYLPVNAERPRLGSAEGAA